MQDFYEPKVGDKAPDFRLPSTRGKEMSLKEHKGKDVILYFYPKDDTPGCTAEACSFRDHESDLAKEHAVVLGVSADSLQSHDKFVGKHSLNFPLLSDATADGAKVDGASAWQTFWSVTLPLLKFTMAVGVMIRLIDLTKLFGLIFILTFGGPGGATETVAFNTYLVGFKDFRMSYASALSFVIVGGVLLLTLVFLWFQRMREARGG